MIHLPVYHFIFASWLPFLDLLALSEPCISSGAVRQLPHWDIACLLGVPAGVLVALFIDRHTRVKPFPTT